MKMKTTDLKNLTFADKAFEMSAQEMNQRFNCAWDDEVHDSFRLLLKQIDDQRVNIHSISSNAETVMNRTDNLNFDGLCQTAENLCREVDSL